MFAPCPAWCGVSVQADISVFGVIRAIEGYPTFVDVMENSNLENWYVACDPYVDRVYNACVAGIQSRAESVSSACTSRHIAVHARIPSSRRTTCYHVFVLLNTMRCAPPEHWSTPLPHHRRAPPHLYITSTVCRCLPRYNRMKARVGDSSLVATADA